MDTAHLDAIATSGWVGPHRRYHHENRSRCAVLVVETSDCNKTDGLGFKRHAMRWQRRCCNRSLRIYEENDLVWKTEYAF